MSYKTKDVRPLPSGYSALRFDAAIGTPVRYFSVSGDPKFRETRTRSVTWRLGHGAEVVNVEGVSGCVLLSHCAVGPFDDHPDSRAGELIPTDGA